jgi:hypothetical protein
MTMLCIHTSSYAVLLQVLVACTTAAEVSLAAQLGFNVRTFDLTDRFLEFCVVVLKRQVVTIVNSAIACRSDMLASSVLEATRGTGVDCVIDFRTTLPAPNQRQLAKFDIINSLAVNSKWLCTCHDLQVRQPHSSSKQSATPPIVDDAD